MNAFPRLLPALCLLAGLAGACAPPRWNPDGGFPPAPPGDPFVHQDGTRLVDGSGAEVSLRGVNLGGWLVWEGWIWGGGWQSEKDMMSRFTELVGADEARAFRERVRDEFIAEADLAEIARAGFNSVRIPFNHALLEEDSDPFVYRPEGWAVLDRVLGWCQEHGLYAVLDLHAAPGGQSGFYMADPDGTSLWDSALNKDRTVELWRAIAQRYSDHPAVAGYDLLNEPSAPGGEALFELYQRIAAAIREVDDRHLIVVEGASAASDFSVFPGPVTGNQAYSFHMYTWFGDPRREEIAKYREISRAHGMPMWNGEFGENSLEMNRSTAQLYLELESGLSGFSFWTWKKVPNGAAFVAGVTARMPAWKKTIDWVANGWNARPTREEAIQGMDEFLRGSRMENVQLDPEMVAGLGGTP